VPNSHATATDISLVTFTPKGVIVNHKVIARLMRQNGLQVRPLRKFVRTTDLPWQLCGRRLRLDGLRPAAFIIPTVVRNPLLSPIAGLSRITA